MTNVATAHELNGAFAELEWDADMNLTPVSPAALCTCIWLVLRCHAVWLVALPVWWMGQASREPKVGRLVPFRVE